MNGGAAAYYLPPFGGSGSALYRAETKGWVNIPDTAPSRLVKAVMLSGSTRRQSVPYRDWAFSHGLQQNLTDCAAD
jgi:hypothetical protein